MLSSESLNCIKEWLFKFLKSGFVALNVEKTQMQILSIKYTEKCKGEAIVVETFTPV